MTTLNERKKIMGIINNKNCSLSLPVQKQLADIVEELEVLEYSVVKQNIQASQSNIINFTMGNYHE